MPLKTLIILCHATITDTIAILIPYYLTVKTPRCCRSMKIHADSAGMSSYQESVLTKQRPPLKLNSQLLSQPAITTSKKRQCRQACRRRLLSTDLSGGRCFVNPRPQRASSSDISSASSLVVPNSCREVNSIRKLHELMTTRGSRYALFKSWPQFQRHN